MKATGGQANAALVGAAVRERLERGSEDGGNGPPDGCRQRGPHPGRRDPRRHRSRSGARAVGPLPALKAQDANIARYEAWRGGVRDDSKTGASVAMEILRRQARIGGARRGVGVVLVVVGFVVR